MVQRYFLEILYKGTRYNGFQSQHNTPETIQGQVEKAFSILQKESVTMTGSSRTDTGVHARQNFFHFDYSGLINPSFRYKMNAILPDDIVVTAIYAVGPEAHCRFDAVARCYDYCTYREKNPFIADRAYYFPYAVDISRMQEAAAVLTSYTDFTSFSKRNTQVKTFNCRIEESLWVEEGELLIYRVRANRFLRGMVRGLTGTMLQVGRGKISIGDFRKIIEAKDCRLADFSVPGHGLFLTRVVFPEEVGMVRMEVR